MFIHPLLQNPDFSLYFSLPEDEERNLSAGLDNLIELMVIIRIVIMVIVVIMVIRSGQCD